MAVRDDFTAGEVLAAADLNDTFASKLDLAGGKVLQVLSFTKVDPFTTTSTSFVDITDLTISITPSSATSKILVTYKVALAPSTSLGFLQLLRGATAIGGGTAAGSRPSSMSAFFIGDVATTDLCGNFLDSPASTSAQTYKIQTRCNSGTTRINVTNSDSDDANAARLSSTITVMEVSA